MIKLVKRTGRKTETGKIAREGSIEKRVHTFVDCVIKRERESEKEKRLSVSVNKSYFSYDGTEATSTSKRGKTSEKMFRSP